MSRFCTSIEQGKKLMELGLSTDWADMKYVSLKEELGLDMYVVEVRDIIETGMWDTEIPAWSMGTLFDMAKDCGWFDDNDIEIGISSSEDVMDYLVGFITEMLTSDSEDEGTRKWKETYMKK